MSFYTLQSDSLTVIISTAGARIVSVQHQGQELVYGPKTATDIHADDCCCGVICGRVANRIAKGKCMIDGKPYSLPINNGENHLHSGFVGFHTQEWSTLRADSSELVLSYSSPDGEGGYPGTMKVTASYRLNGNKLILDMEAISDKNTLLNLTNHVYWNLNGEADIRNHKLQIQAKEYTPMISNIPTGAIAPVKGAFNFLEARRLGDLIGEGKAMPDGFDDNYCLIPTEIHCVTLSVEGRSLSLSTDAEGLQLYTGCYLPNKFGGIALEAQSYPDAPNHPNFPQINLSAGVSRQRRISWQID